jgi:proline iminopeptidase
VVGEGILAHLVACDIRYESASPRGKIEVRSFDCAPGGDEPLERKQRMIVRVKGAELFYSTRGSGPVCLVLCSIGTKPFELMMPTQLSDRMKLVFVDLRGGGKSTGEPADLTFDVLADDLEAIREDLGVKHVAVIGHSILGVLAIEYGRRCQASVSHVITAGTPPKGDMAWLAAKATEFFEKDASEDRKRVLRENLAALPVGAPLSQALLAQTPARFFDARLDAAPLFAEAESKPAMLSHLLGDLTRAWDVIIGADSLRVPIFLAHGRYDYVVPHILWDGLAEKLPNATLQIFERSGHQPFFEEPDRFTDAVVGWMARHR